VIGVFTDVSTAWKNVLRVEYKKNIALTSFEDSVLAKTLFERREMYTEFNKRLDDKAVPITEKFLVDWEHARDELLQCHTYGFRGDVANCRVVEKNVMLTS
jgi:hypothetical protein